MRPRISNTILSSFSRIIQCDQVIMKNMIIQCDQVISKNNFTGGRKGRFQMAFSQWNRTTLYLQ